MNASAILLAWIFVLGASIGSFLNVVIYRLPRGFRLALPSRSMCPSCKRRLPWYENVPLLGYVALRGKCRKCGARIPGRYLLVELLTGVLFVAVYLNFGLSLQTLNFAVLTSLLVAITFIDIDYRIIPDKLSIPGAMLGVFGAALIPGLSLSSSLIGLASGSLFLWALAAGYQRLTGREGMGLGDVKLIGMIGAFLGLPGVIGTIVISSIAGSVVGLTLVVVQRKTLKLALPYGPFLAIGALVWMFWGDTIFVTLYPQFYGQSY